MSLAGRNAAGILAQETLFGADIQAGEQGQTFVGYQGHDPALMFERPQFEGQASTEGMSGRNHLGARQARGLGQLLDGQADQFGQEQEQTAALGGEAARSQGELAHVGDCLESGARTLRPFFIQAPRQRGKAFGLENLAHGGGTQEQLLSFEQLADFIHRVVLFAQLNDERAGGGFFGLGAWSGSGGEEESGMRVVGEAMAKDPEGAGGIAEVAGDLLGRAAVEEESAQGFVLAVFGKARFEEEALRVC